MRDMKAIEFEMNDRRYWHARAVEDQERATESLMRAAHDVGRIAEQMRVLQCEADAADCCARRAAVGAAMTVCLNCGDLPRESEPAPCEGGITRAQQILEIAGIMSRIVGSIAAIECARSIAQASADGFMSPGTATIACMAHRRTHSATYGATWAQVTERHISECASAVAGVGVVQS